MRGLLLQAACPNASAGENARSEGLQAACSGVPNKPTVKAVLRLVLGAVNLLLLPSTGSDLCCGVALQYTGCAVTVSFLGQAQGRSSGGLLACPSTSIQSCACTCRFGALSG